MDVIGLGAVLYTDMFIREVVIWELGRTRDTGQSISKGVRLSSSKANSYLQHPCKQTERIYQFDPIPMTYAELLPILLEKNLVKTRTPPRVPNELLVWYQADLSCAFHQGAPGHDVEHCFSLKIEVQKLIEANMLLFEG
ncbi:hypothetical protein MTR_0001s0260 [Medicago truncatula]|uniref:Uncharacterized protein n=1 Tax=Medicago truncatula TaxID=3880 RepID=A0A072TW56_MEDTR|nr:hypothetical protein MTR_0001s0260 [Medicago truncatula]